MKKILLFLFYFSALSIYAQIQIGSDIDGETSGDQSGRFVSISSNGTRVAIGAHTNDGTGVDAGHVRIYEESAGVWTQVGSDIDGEAVGDESGFSVSLSSDGTRVAIGAILNDGNGTNAGHVRIYEESAGAWTQVGSDIDGEAAFDFSGWSVSLSSDGTRVAIGAIFNDNIWLNAGHVRIYEESGGTWSQVGGNIYGEGGSGWTGSSVSLSSNGTRVAIGASRNSGIGYEAGHVRIYEESGGTWIKIGSDIDGEAVSDHSGGSVSISSSGTRVAIGATRNMTLAGHVRIYEEISGTWIQIGSDIDGEANYDESGVSVSLSSDGTIVAIGAYRNDGNGTDAGHVRIYEEISGTWIQIGSDIDGEAASDFSGGSVSLSSDGTRVASGAINNDGNGTDAGHVRVYGNIPLPIELASFTGRSLLNSIQLNWVTLNEQNNSGFEIQKSNDGRAWESIDFVVGKGTTNQTIEYQYQDSNPFPGINYYRLKQLDFDGKHEYSKIISVKFKSNSKVINIFPNPTIGEIEISGLENEMTKLQLFNSLGEVVLETNQPTEKIDLTHLPNGVYFLRIENRRISSFQQIVKN